MTPFEKLTEVDKQKIDRYRKYYTYSHKGEYCSVDHYLRFWNKEKQNIFNLFGEELIIEIPISYKSDQEEIVDRLRDIARNNKSFKDFETAISRLFPYNGLGNEDHWAIHNILGYDSLAKNAVIGNYHHQITLKDGSKLKFQKGTKPMKLLRKIAESYGVPGFQEFCNLHSQALQTQELHGTLCLSIHPLDYMTMSDNSLGWKTCMNWSEDGEFRQGTVEMMNSPIVVVGYLKSDEPFYFGDETAEEVWNNKKWRCLFIIDNANDFAISVKDYPYHNNFLLKESLRVIAKQLGWERTEPHVFNSTQSNIIKGKEIIIYPETYSMYNDFGSTEQYIIVNPKRIEDFRDTAYCYSGVSECVACGGIDEIAGPDRESDLCCLNCLPYEICAGCGCHVYDTYWMGDLPVCEYCYNEETFYDDITDGQYWNDNSCFIQLTRGKDNVETVGYKIKTLYEVWNTDPENWARYFTIKKPYHYEYLLYVNIEDCTDEGLRLFGIWNEEDLKRYQAGPRSKLDF